MVMCGLSSKLNLALRTLRQVGSDAKIILLAQMHEEPAAMQLVGSAYNGTSAADDYLICPIRVIRFYESVMHPKVERVAEIAAPAPVDAGREMKIKQLEKVIYYEEYIVIDPGTTNLKKMQLLNEADYRKSLEQYGKEFKVAIGGEAIKELLNGIDLAKLSKTIRKSIEKGRVGVNKRLLKRLKIVEDLRRSGNEPYWLVLDVFPVIPPDLRPLVPLEGGRFASSDLNDLYRRVINRNNRLKN